MSSKKNNIQAFFSALPKNIFSGFVVSLIALPLGLGLAMASEAPPISGIIAAVVGGLLVSILGGSHVTISGPGNGLVGVLLVAITTLGIQGAYAAIICSGMLLVLLGFLRMGKLADFFPSSAIQGMLAAIGLIILGKQFHIMLGNKLSLEGSISYLLAIPETIQGVFYYQDTGLTFAAISGVLSLAIMVFYSKIRNQYLQLIPAPMWIVLLSIGFSYYYEMVLQQPNPISAMYMISGIPSANQIIEEIPVPNFSAIGSLSFWTSVLALTLIASIESLLSIKAVDKLDPQKRRSNVNRDLKALGLATVGSGFLGGLNVVTVIARSSVNVNNGGSNRSANFMHALFLVIFIVLFSTQLTRIPLPALMAILVYTGYKLASPTLVRKIFSVGKEQLLIFFTTLLVTLFVDLITGIVAGLVVTFIIHVLVNKGAAVFIRNFLKPNVLMFQEKENGNYYVSVKHFCSFLNFYKLKQKLEDVPEDKDVVVDFSMCQFVDHTVMESVSGYQDVFAKRGGHFEVIGLDLHGTDSQHPFALRKLIPGLTKRSGALTKRQLTLQEISKDFNLQYQASRSEDVRFLDGFKHFSTKQIERIYNRLFNTENTFKLFDINYSEGEFIAKEDVRTTMLHIKLNSVIPGFTLDQEGFLEKVSAFAGFKDIAIENHSDFSRRFYLRGKDSVAIQNFFTDNLVLFFESNPYYHVESNGTSVLVYSKERVAGIKEIKNLHDFGKRLQTELLICTQNLG
ncbi:SulP family inorganic anion transporter [Flavobacteriaceae bacterium]|nr:SulP family inorganic anion transporter [Flavobacteriaceae bacterium]MDB4303115.1 SulP family inorganic anion transporter [bacterium]MDB9828481.1 SulP family inorganic anion transporter [Flavobacteriaceae bacterium]